MVAFQTMINNQKQQVSYAVQPGLIITSPLTSLNRENNSSNKRIQNNLSGDDILQQ